MQIATSNSPPKNKQHPQTKEQQQQRKATMCIAQDRRRSSSSGPKAIGHPISPAKYTLQALIEAGKVKHQQQQQNKHHCTDPHDHARDDATVSTVASQESHLLFPHHDDEGTTARVRGDEVDVSLAPSLSADLSFLDVPTGGVISMPREGGSSRHSSPRAANTRPLGVAEDAKLPALLPREEDTSAVAAASPPATPDTKKKPFSKRSLYVEVFKPPPFPSSAYHTPTSTGSSSSRRHPYSPPPTPKHKRLLFGRGSDGEEVHFEWPEHLLLPSLTI